MTLTRITRRDGESYSCSYGQLATWLAERLRPDRTTMNVLVSLRLRGRLDRAALAGAFADLVARHEILRTVFVEVDGEPRQRILPSIEIPVTEVDLRELPEPARDHRAHELAEAAAGQPFDPAAGPLLRVTLVRLADAEHLLLWVWHHLTNDGWSVGQAMRELRGHYARRCGVDVPAPPPLPIQYVDYAVWQRRWATGGEFTAGAERLRERLAGDPRPDPVLPCVPARPGGRPRGARRFLTLPGELVRGLRQAARPLGTTPFHLLLTGYLGLLSRYTGCADLTVGVLVSGRSRPELEPLIGTFVNLLPIRVEVAERASFRSVVGAVRAATMEVLTHQEVPYELFGLGDGGPPIRFSCATQERAAEPEGWAGLTELPWFHDFDDAIWDLSVSGAPVAGGGLDVSLQYRTDLFDEATVTRLGDHLRTLLTAMAAEPDRPIGELPMLGEDERRRMVAEWNPPGPAEPPAGVLASIEDWARRTPDAVALVDPDGTELTYEELLRRAYRVADRLRLLRVRPGDRVGVHLERGSAAVVAILGAMAARAGFVPVSGLAPAARIEAQLADAAARFVLTDTTHAVRLPGSVRAVEVADAVGQEAGGGERVAPEPDDLAYVIYTSGSTGAPKGVEVTHANLATTARAWQEVLDLPGSGIRLLQSADLGFDVFVSDLVRALCNGGSLVFCPREVLLDPPRLHAFMVERSVTAAFLVPAVARLLVGHLRATGGRLDFLELLILGVERMYAGEFAELVALAGPRTRVINSYGVTEATIDSTVHLGPVPAAPATATVPIGRPLPGTTAYILDRHRQPCPVGVEGELYLGGDAVARGYTRGAGEAAAARFLPDPFRAGGRLYRTGDLARYHPDGAIELIGRADEQLKIRGYRIEPGEVEAALRELPELASCVVVAREPTPGDPRLVAYLVPAGQELAVEAVRAHLAARLPAYQLPSAFVVLPALPLGPGGKVDRAALPAPDDPGGAGYAAPRTPAETRLAEIWAKLLGIDRVGVHDGFVALGGHSLHAARLIGEVDAAFGVLIPLPAVFDRGTVAGLAELVTELVTAEIADMSDAEAARLLERLS